MSQFDKCVEETYQRWRFSQQRGIASFGCFSFKLTQRVHSASCHLILLAGRSQYWPGENKGICLEMQRLNLKHNWFGVYHRSYLDISFDFQVLNVILNKIWPHSSLLCDTERLYLPPNAIQA